MKDGKSLELERQFTLWFERHVSSVGAFVQRRVAPPDVDDIVIEVFTTAWRHFRPGAEQELGQPWLYRAALNAISNSRRSSARRERIVAKVLALPPDPPDEPGPRSAWHSGGLHEAFRTLSPRDQEVLRLTAWEELTPVQAAELQGCSSSAFAVRSHRARQRLRAALERQEGRSTHHGRCLTILPEVSP